MGGVELSDVVLGSGRLDASGDVDGPVAELVVEVAGRESAVVSAEAVSHPDRVADWA